ncbi:MAG TPA: OsmC family protein [Chloroflexia bacterium]|nr:OsmC family protein [Chloroflexia bacterium]
MINADIREYEVKAHSTDTFGRVMCSARNHYFVVDGPVQNGCPGEEITPSELFLSAVAACGVELLQVIARQQEVALAGSSVRVYGMMDRSNPVRPDVALFNSVSLHFLLKGVTQEEGEGLVQAFRGR